MIQENPQGLWRSFAKSKYIVEIRIDQDSNPSNSPENDQSQLRLADSENVQLVRLESDSDRNGV